MRCYLFLLFLLTSSLCASQSFSLKADSLLKAHLQKLSPEQKEHFETMLTKTKYTSYLESTDTSSCQYYFIRSTYNFNESNSTNMFNCFLEDDPLYTTYFLDWKKKMKPIQEVDYEKKEVTIHDKKCLAKSQYIEKRKLRLESTYEILTTINRNTGEVRVSLQYPPKKAVCRTKYIRGGKC